MGHRVLKTYVNTDTILDDIDIECPDIYIIDYRLLGNMNGIEVVMEILNKFPSACIIFITAYEFLEQEISKQEIYCNVRCKAWVLFMISLKLFFLRIGNRYFAPYALKHELNLDLIMTYSEIRNSI